MFIPFCARVIMHSKVCKMRAKRYCIDCVGMLCLFSFVGFLSESP